MDSGPRRVFPSLVDIPESPAILGAAAGRRLTDMFIPFVCPVCGERGEGPILAHVREKGDPRHVVLEIMVS